MWRWLLVGAVLVLRFAGVILVGFVATGSMEPTIPQGSLFLALPAGSPGVGDVVVYEHPDGRLVVHRVVSMTADGKLVTQGDANAVTDQEVGVPPVDPGTVRIVPHAGSHPLALRGEWVKAGGFFLVEFLILVHAFRWLISSRKKRRQRVPSRFQPRATHVLALGALLLLLTTPFLHKHVESAGIVGLTAPPLPSFARVVTTSGTEVIFLWPFQPMEIKAVGPVDVVWVPALPGARSLSAEGAAFGMLPLVAVLLGGAFVTREWGV